jgi:hypothetical protein
MAQRKYRKGDRIQFLSNGVLGQVVRNMGPAVNTRTGNDVIEWREVLPDGAGGERLGAVCVHDAEKLWLVMAAVSAFPKPGVLR